VPAPQVANHCSQQGMQFLLAVRGCPTDNTIYTPVVPINVNCKGAAGSALGLPGGGAAGAGAGGAGAAGAGGGAMMTGAQQEAFTKTRAAQAQGKSFGSGSPLSGFFNGAGAARGAGAAAMAAMAAGAAALLLL
jgi:hypothetical protein